VGSYGQVQGVTDQEVTGSCLTVLVLAALGMAVGTGHTHIEAPESRYRCCRPPALLRAQNERPWHAPLPPEAAVRAPMRPNRPVLAACGNALAFQRFSVPAITLLRAPSHNCTNCYLADRGR
jgi:hypothetical protein